MKSDDVPGWAPAAGAAILAALLGVFALVAAGGWNWFAKFLESSLPAWVQAVGSIAAIVAAIRISSRQHEQMVAREERREAFTRTQTIAMPLAVVERAIRKLHDCRSHVVRAFGVNGDWGTSVERVKEASALVAQYAALPLHTMPGYNEVATAYSLLDDLQEAVARLEALAKRRDVALKVDQDLLLAFDVAMGRADTWYESLSEDWVASLKKAHGV